MGDDLDPLTTRDSEHEISNREIIIMMILLMVVVSVIAMLFAGIRFGIGVCFGGLLALGNYRWLDQSTRALLVPNAVSTTGILASKYILRYLLIGLVLLGVYAVDLFPVTSVLLGLGSFSFAVVIVGLRKIFKK